MKVKIIVLAILLFIVVFIAAYVASTSRGYLDVSELKGFSGGSVNVIGLIADYSISGDKLEIILEGRRGDRVLLEIPLTLFNSAHSKPPGPWIIGKSIGIRGYYVNSSNDNLLGVIRVDEILSPCHESYKAPPART
ncbi:MAG: hypothetical protein QXI24_06035 [Acidilobaceae archaeon]